MFGAFVDKMDEAGYRVQAEQVYSEDQFTELAGDNPGIHHKINRFKPRGSYVGTYIILRAKKDGQVAVREFVSSDEMAKIRGCAQTDNVWQKWFDEKCKAAAIKRAAKRLSLSPEFEKMIDFDNEDNDPTGMKNITGSAFSSDPQDPKESSKLAAALNLKKGSEIEIPESTNKENLTVEETSKKEADEIFG